MGQVKDQVNMSQNEEEDSGRGIDPGEKSVDEQVDNNEESSHTLTSHLPLSEEEEFDDAYEGEQEESVNEQVKNNGECMPLFDAVDEVTSQRSQHSRRGLLSPGGFRRPDLTSPSPPNHVPQAKWTTELSFPILFKELVDWRVLQPYVAGHRE